MDGPVGKMRGLPARWGDPAQLHIGTMPLRSGPVGGCNIATQVPSKLGFLHERMVGTVIGPVATYAAWRMEVAIPRASDGCHQDSARLRKPCDPSQRRALYGSIPVLPLSFCFFFVFFLLLFLLPSSCTSCSSNLSFFLLLVLSSFSL